jgi:hypothetical protein
MTTINDIPRSELEELKRRLIDQMNSMDAAELQIVTRTRESLGTFIAGFLESAAAMIGYAIAIPIAWAVTFAEKIAEGFGRGWESAWKSVRPAD